MKNSTIKKNPTGVYVGGTTKHKSFAYQISGFAINDAVYYGAVGEKKSFARVAIAIDGNAWDALARTNKDVDYSGYAETQFIEVVAFGGMAGVLKDVTKKTRLVVSGRLSEDTFKRKDGSDGHAVKLEANYVAVATDGNALPSFVGGVSYVHEGKEINLVCGLGAKINSIEPMTDVNGTPLLTMNVESPAKIDIAYALATGTYSKETNYGVFNSQINVWGNRAVALEKIMRIGDEIIVSGAVREWNGRYTTDLRAMQIVTRGEMPAAVEAPVETLTPVAEAPVEVAVEAPAEAPVEVQAPANEVPDGWTVMAEDDCDLPFPEYVQGDDCCFSELTSDDLAEDDLPF